MQTEWNAQLPIVYPWIPDQGDGTFRNPVIHADYSDPDVIRHGDDFWMVASSFTCTPGLPILHSRDLVNWTLVNHAIKNVPHPRYQDVQPGCGVWAPSIRFHAGKFWIFFPMPDEGIYVVSAEDPVGKWSEPWLLQEAMGWIDPCPLQHGHTPAKPNTAAGWVRKSDSSASPNKPSPRSVLPTLTISGSHENDKTDRDSLTCSSLAHGRCRRNNERASVAGKPGFPIPAERDVFRMDERDRDHRDGVFVDSGGVPATARPAHIMLQCP